MRDEEGIEGIEGITVIAIRHARSCKGNKCMERHADYAVVVMTFSGSCPARCHGDRGNLSRTASSSQ